MGGRLRLSAVVRLRMVHESIVSCSVSMVRMIHMGKIGTE